MEYANIQNFVAAMNLMKFKAMRQMAEGKTTCSLDENDVNEILMVAGLPIITPESLKTKTLEVMH